MTEYVQKSFKITMDPKGAYDSTKTYQFNDLVQGSDGVYASKDDGNVGHQLTDTTWWEKLIDLSSVQNATQAATSAAGSASQTNQQVQAAEQTRVSNETQRSQAETARQQAENTRQQNETSREQQETERKNSESSRSQAETQRVNAEESRSSAETQRSQAESQRAQTFTTNESQRQQTFEENEETRSSNESGRVSAENARVTAESQRQVSEQARSLAETQRSQAEAGRASTFTTNEQQRQQTADNAETTRSNTFNSNESARQTTAADHRAAESATFAAKESQRDAAVATATALTPRVTSLETDTSRLNALMGLYTDRESLYLRTDAEGAQNGKAIVPAVAGSQYGKVAAYTGAYVSQEFSLTRGDLLLIKPGKTSNDVFTVSQVTTSSDGNKTYTKVMSLNALAEVPTDGYLRFLVMPADMTVCITFFPSETAFQSEVKVMRCGSFASICTQVGNIYAELVSNYVQKNDYVPGLTAGSALGLVGKGTGTSITVGTGGRTVPDTIGKGVSAKVTKIEGRSVAWRQMVKNNGTDEERKVTIGGTYAYPTKTDLRNRQYLYYNSALDTPAWQVLTKGTEEQMQCAADDKLLDIPLTFGTENAVAILNASEPMNYCANLLGFDTWQKYCDSAQFETDMEYKAEGELIPTRPQALRSEGVTATGETFSISRELSDAIAQAFPDGMRQAGSVSDSIEVSGGVVKAVRRVGVKVCNGTEPWSHVQYGTCNRFQYVIDDASHNGAESTLNNGGYAYSPYASDWESLAVDKTYKLYGGFLPLFIDNSYSSSDLWKSHLAELYNSDKPLIFFYELATPVETILPATSLDLALLSGGGTLTLVPQTGQRTAPLKATMNVSRDYVTLIEECAKKLNLWDA